MNGGPAEAMLRYTIRLRFPFPDGQRETLALCARRQQERTHRSRQTHADGGDVGLDVVHGVVDRHTCGDRTTGRIDIERDVLIRVLALEVEQLCDDERRGGVVDLVGQHDDAVI